MSDGSYNIQVYAASGQDFTGDEGKIVNWAAIASGKARATLATAASAQSLGVITGVEIDGSAQRVTICIWGPCKVRCGDTFTPGATEMAFVADASGLAVPGSAGDRVVGRIVPADGIAPVSGAISLCIIYPHELEA